MRLIGLKVRNLITNAIAQKFNYVMKVIYLDYVFKPLKITYSLK